MRIDFDRICKLAGVSNNSSRSLMREGDYSNEVEEMDMEEMDMEEAAMMHEELPGDEASEMSAMEMDMEESNEEDANELVDVNIHELMSEIRRAKKIMKMNEAKKQRQSNRQRRLQENHLKRVIQKEVDNILSEIEEKDSSWMYGNRQPKHSRKGYTNQGRTLPGIGFNKKW